MFVFDVTSHKSGPRQCYRSRAATPSRKGRSAPGLTPGADDAHLDLPRGVPHAWKSTGASIDRMRYPWVQATALRRPAM
jgi:hypothetical protein